MRIVWATRAWRDYLYWQSSNPRVADKINRLIADIAANPFSGIGKPEPLKKDMTGWWSRRIDKEHRLVYRVAGMPRKDQRIEIAQCRYHY
ncbi:MAG: Txe/YoeB family addiction module toxin [Rhizobiaceae bacterium]|nr:MAG: Txe/YoeB family addiction module toxin [Rhizobiaceae bacterium]